MLRLPRLPDHSGAELDTILPPPVLDGLRAGARVPRRCAWIAAIQAPAAHRQGGSIGTARACCPCIARASSARSAHLAGRAWPCQWKHMGRPCRAGRACMGGGGARMPRHAPASCSRRPPVPLVAVRLRGLPFDVTEDEIRIFLVRMPAGLGRGHGCPAAHRRGEGRSQHPQRQGCAMVGIARVASGDWGRMPPVGPGGRQADALHAAPPQHGQPGASAGGRTGRRGSASLVAPMGNCWRRRRRRCAPPCRCGCHRAASQWTSCW